MLISEKSTISISLVIALVGGIFWFSTIYATANQTASTVEKHEIKLDQINDKLDDIMVDLAELKTELKSRRK